MSRSPIAHSAFSTANDASAVHTPGEVVEVITSTGLKRYQYVKFDDGTDNTALAAKEPVGYKLGDHTTVLRDLSDTVANMIAGVALNAITSTYYGWIQTWGEASVLMNNDDDAATGMTVIWSADGVCDTVAAGTASTYRPVGICDVAVVANTNTAGGLSDSLVIC